MSARRGSRASVAASSGAAAAGRAGAVPASSERLEATALRPMCPADLDAVMAVEAACYPFPWSRGNFIDSLAAGYPARLLLDPVAGLLGYFVAMPGVDEMHLLNLSVAPGAQGRGHASRLLASLRALCREARAAQLWLEVRQSNEHAQAVYRHLGFAPIGVRKGYYPAPSGRREDAVVMSLRIAPRDGGEGDADALV